MDRNVQINHNKAKQCNVTFICFYFYLVKIHFVSERVYDSKSQKPGSAGAGKFVLISDAVELFEGFEPGN